jgi:hypothetical protein
MAYISTDGVVILEYPEEVIQFVVSSPCDECANDARQLLLALNGRPMRCGLSTECEHTDD